MASILSADRETVIDNDSSFTINNNKISSVYLPTSAVEIYAAFFTRSCSYLV
jgi:hypothetical protein